MRTLRVLPAAVLVVATLRAQGTQPPPSPVTLDEALAAALANNPDIAAARLERPVDLANVDVAHERPNPDVTYEGARDTPRESVGLSVPIELGGKRGARTAAAKAAVATGEARIDQVTATVLDEVRHAYIDLVGAERRVTITQQVEGLYQRAADAAHARYVAGDAAERDDVAAQADLLVARTDVTGAQGEADAARIALNVLLGRQPASPLATAFAQETPAVPTLEGALARVQDANADLRLLDRQIAEQTAQVSVAQSLQKPDLTAAGAVTWDAKPDFAVGWRADLSLTIPLFTTHRAGVVVARSELAQLQAQRQALLATITGSVASAIARANSASRRATSYQSDILPLSTRAEDFAQRAYQAGQTDIETLIVALQHARDQQMAGLQAILDLQTSLADLERAINGPVR